MLAGGVGLIAKAVQDFQTVLRETASLIAPTNSAAEQVDLSVFPSPSSACEINDSKIDYPSLYVQENKDMNEYESDGKDLSGDDIKYVSYSILFKKPDFEATLQPEKEEVVDYSTDGASFGAIKISEYIENLAKGNKIPSSWGNKSPDDKLYGVNKAKTMFGMIPAKDRKHIKFVYRVKERLDKEKPRYEKEQVDAIKDVQQAIKDMWK